MRELKAYCINRQWVLDLVEVRRVMGLAVLAMAARVLLFEFRM